MGEFSKPKVLIDQEEYLFLKETEKAYQDEWNGKSERQPETVNLLVSAMRHYPYGTIFKSPFGGDKTYISTGVFNLAHRGSIVMIMADDDKVYVYDSSYNQWGEIVTSVTESPSEKPKSILEGKVAIQVGNEREFKLLMEHYQTKDWKWCNGRSPLRPMNNIEFPTTIFYGDDFYWNLIDGTREVSFSDFTAEVGIEVPKFIMKSEDGVDLYEGDLLVPVYRKYMGGRNNGDWYLEDPFQIKKGIIYTCMEPESIDRSKAFSTKEAAEAWIAEHKVAILISQDGVPLYKGDNCWMAIQNAKQWALASHEDHRVDKHIFTVTDNGVFDPNSPFAKIFATKKEAEKWITEANKPKEVEVKLFNNRTAKVSKNSILITKDETTIKLWPSDIEDLSHALKSL